MTRVRMTTYEETPFGAWVRAHPEIESRSSGLAVTDIDWCFHKYRQGTDTLGSRNLQLMMWLELKCRDAEPTPSQFDTLAILNQLLDSKRKVRRLNRSPIMLWAYGVSVLSLPGTSPNEYAHCRWGRFDTVTDDEIVFKWTTIPAEILPKILGFQIHPETLQSLEIRRHHKIDAYITKEVMPLGFRVDTVHIKRS